MIFHLLFFYSNFNTRKGEKHSVEGFAKMLTHEELE